MRAGVPRGRAETGPHAHSITRWLGKDSPDDLTPHLTTLTADEAARGWLMVCSDGLWNYCSEAEDLRALLRERQARVGDDAGRRWRRRSSTSPTSRGDATTSRLPLRDWLGKDRMTRTGQPTTAAPEEGAPING